MLPKDANKIFFYVSSDCKKPLCSSAYICFHHLYYVYIINVCASLVAQMVGNCLQCGFLGSIPGLGRSPGGGHGNLVFLPGESPWIEEPGRLKSMRLQRVEHN